MKKFIFISDFDGTMTAKDFYRIIMEKYLGNWGKSLYDSWKRGEMYDVEFLSQVFKAINRTQTEIDEDIAKIELDEYMPKFIKAIKQAGGDFIILSAGTSYYIERLLNFRQLHGIQVIANDGIYENRGITLIPPAKEHPYFSERYGLDKAKVVARLKQEYSSVYYAGDSGPDVNAALLADTIFAKSELITLIKAKGHPFVPFTSYKQVAEFLQKNGVIDA